MRLAALTLMLMLSGCDQLFGLTPVASVTDADVSDGAPTDAACLGTGILTGLCVESTEAQVTLAFAINTTTDPRCRIVPQVMGPELCVIDAMTFVVSEYVPVTGERPLVLLATKDILIDDVLDASSKLGVRTGAAAQATCASGSGANGTVGGGGGAGGTFGHVGGGGAAGQIGLQIPASGGAPSSVAPLDGIQGGCAGGNGGVVTGTAARGGAGGGALYLIAGERIHVSSTGVINASGGGGGGAPTAGGGGGGGAGGFIALDAPAIAIEGHVFARGGAGGGGGGSTTNGSPGAEPANATAQTPGGSAGSGGTPGGDGCGAPEGKQGGFTAAAGAGGGGGGGGCGRTRIYGTRAGTGPINPAPE